MSRLQRSFCALFVGLFGWAPAMAAGNGVSQAKLIAVHIESGIPYLFFDKPINNPDGCASNATLTLAADLTNQQSYLSLAMTAFAAGKSITAWVQGCGYAPWAASVPKIYAMQMTP